MNRRRGLKPSEWAIIAIGVVTVAEWLILSAIFAQKPLPLAPVKDAALAEMLDKRYGPTRHSEDREEWIVRDFFQDERGGVFVDVGAGDYMDGSNTYTLETKLGWSGLAVDALEHFAPDYREHRPKTTFVARFVSDRADARETIYIPQKRNQTMTSFDREFAERSGAAVEARQVPTTTLDRLLEAHRISRIDFLSMDIELAEPKALAGFSIGRFQPRLVCIEAHDEVSQQILNYFHDNGYVLVGKYLYVDNDNYWFAPVGHSNPAPRFAAARLGR
jgi:FkbM family methyltransferase